MRQFLIGIPIPRGWSPEQVRGTLAALRANTPAVVAGVPSPFGAGAVFLASPTAERSADLRELAAACRVPVLAADRDDATCATNYLGILARAAPAAAALVLLEAGARVGPGWIGRLLAALDADPRHAIAGPSTNRSANEQCQRALLPSGILGGSLAQVADAAAEAYRRYGPAIEPLQPGRGPEAFCVAARREFAEDVCGGQAAPTVGRGPVGVWACGAYVWRPPLVSPDQSRPPVRARQASARRTPDRRSAESPRPSFPPAEAPSGWPASRMSVSRPSLPLLSCLMPTRNRPAFLRQSLACFARQDYPNLELIVLDDSDDSRAAEVAALAARDGRVRVVRTRAGESIGAKRNRGLALARGTLIAQWDDDDWYAPTRLSAQAAPLLAGRADVTALDAGVWFDVAAWAFWRASPALHRRLFVADVHGGTLVYRRSVATRPGGAGSYPDRSLAEDAMFLRAAIGRGARLVRVPNDGLFVYVRHGGNSWRVAAGGAAAGWLRVPEPPFPPDDRAFYAALSSGAEAPAARDAGAAFDPRLPRVSCIMPTADRRALVPLAVACFLRQDYPARELVVVDDGADRIDDLLPAGDPRVRYVRPRGARRSIGAKRNLACTEARGEVIVHWDDDDWSAPDRLSRQVAALLHPADGGTPDVSGLDRVLYHAPATGRSWLYSYAGCRAWVAGNTLCYRKSLWRANPFPDVSVGEDARFLWSGRATRIRPMADFCFFIARIHDGNASVKRVDRPCWHAHSTEEVRRILAEDWRAFSGTAGLPARPCPDVASVHGA